MKINCRCNFVFVFFFSVLAITLIDEFIALISAFERRLMEGNSDYAGLATAR